MKEQLQKDFYNNIKNLKHSISNEINEAFEYSYKSKFPGKKYLYKHIYKKEL